MVKQNPSLSNSADDMTLFHIPVTACYARRELLCAIDMSDQLHLFTCRNAVPQTLKSHVLFRDCFCVAMEHLALFSDTNATTQAYFLWEGGWLQTVAFSV